MKSFIAFLLGCLLICSANAGSTLLTAKVIDASKVTEGMPITDHKILKSGDGRKKQLWSVQAMGNSTIEIIGNDQSDADQVGLRCVTFDKSGNADSPLLPNAQCHKLFVKLLAKFTSVPDSFAQKLIEESIRSGKTESRRLDDFSFETDGEFYFVRRLSRSRT